MRLIIWKLRQQFIQIMSDIQSIASQAVKSSIASSTDKGSSELQFYSIKGQSMINYLTDSNINESTSLSKQLVEKVKLKIFKLNHLLLTYQTVGSYTYQFILLFEFLQIVFFIFYKVTILNEYSILEPNSTTQTLPQLNQTLPLQNQSSRVSYQTFKIESYFVFFNFHMYVFQTHSFKVYLIVASLLSFVFLLYLVLGLFCSISWFEQERSLILKDSSKFMIKVFSFLMALFLFILQIPIMTIYFQAFLCNEEVGSQFGLDSVNCSGNGFIGNAVVSGVMLVTYFWFIIIQSMVYTSSNFDSDTPWSSLERRFALVKILLKVVLSTTFICDKQASSKKWVELVCFILSLYILFQRLNKALIFNKSVFYTSVFYEITMSWLFLWMGIQIFAGNMVSITDLMMIIVISILTTTIFIIFYNKRRESHMLKDPHISFTTTSEYELYFFWLCTLISNDCVSDKIMLDGILSCHLMNCREENCSCMMISEKLHDYTKNEKIAYTQLTQTMRAKENHKGKEERQDQVQMNITRAQNFDKDNQNSKLLLKKKNIEGKWYKFVAIILCDAMKKFPKSVSLKLISSYIQKSKINNEFKAIFDLMNCELCKPSLQEQFIVFQSKIQIEGILKIKHQKNIMDFGKLDVVNIYTYEKYQENYLQLEYMTANAALNFWSELLNKSIDTNNLQLKGAEISRNFEKIQDLAVKLQNIYPNEIKFLFKYGIFLKEIVNNGYEAVNILQKAYCIYSSRISRRIMASNEFYQFGENSGTAIIIIECTSSSIGTVLHSNEEIETMLGYKRKELIGNNINMIMPRQIGKVHDKFIQRYFETAQATVIDKKRELFAVDKNGYLRAITLLVKVFPQLLERLIFVGFIQTCDKFSEMESAKQEFENFESHYIIGDLDGNIHNITYGLNLELGLNSKLFSYSDSIFQSLFQFQKIFPEVLDQEMEEMMENEGVEITLNTTDMLTYIDVEKFQYEEILEMKSKLGCYHVYIQMKNVVLDSSFCHFKLYRICISGLRSSLTSKFVSGMLSINGNQSNDNDLQAMQSMISANMDSDEMLTFSSQSSSTTSVSFNRILQDFKKALSERRTPKNLIFMNRVIWIILFSLIILASADFSLKLQNIGTIDLIASQMISIQHRTTTLIELLSFIRSFINVANNLEFSSYEPNLSFPNSTSSTLRFDYLRALIQSKITNLQSLNQNISKFNKDFNDFDFQEEYTNITFSKINSDREESNYSFTFSEGLQLYIDYTAYLNQSNQSFYAIPSCISSPQSLSNKANCRNLSILSRNIYFILTNGPQTLRLSTIAIAETYQETLYLYLSEFKIEFIIILALAVVILSCSFLFLAKGLRTIENNKVSILSLYAMLTLPDILKIYARSDLYFRVLKGDKKGKKNQGYRSIRGNEVGKQSRQEKKYQEYVKTAIESIKEIQEVELRQIEESAKRKQQRRKHRHMVENNLNEEEESKPVVKEKEVDVLAEKANTPPQSPGNQKAKNLLDKLKVKEDQEEEQVDCEELQRVNEAKLTEKDLENRKNQFNKAKNSGQWLQYLLLVALISMLTAYFVFSFVYHIIVQQEVATGAVSIPLLFRKNIMQSLAFYFLRERIQNNNTLINEVPNIDEYFYQQSVDTETSLSLIEQTDNTILNPVLEYMNRIDAGQFCDNVRANASATLENWGLINAEVMDQCANMSQGLFEQGYDYILGIYHKQFIDVYLQLANNATSNTQYLQFYINSQQKALREPPTSTNQTVYYEFFAAQEHFLFQVSITINALLSDSFSTHISEYIQVVKALFSLFVSILLMIMFVFRRKLLLKLRTKIIQSRGILNLIPEEFFDQHRKEVEELIKKLKD